MICVVVFGPPVKCWARARARARATYRDRLRLRLGLGLGLGLQRCYWTGVRILRDSISDKLLLL